MLIFKRVSGVLMAAAALVSCGGRTPAGPPAGLALFQKHCSACHGADGKGKVAKVDITTADWQKAHGDEQIVKVVREGNTIKGMPAFEKILKDEEVKVIIADVIRRFGKEGG